MERAWAVLAQVLTLIDINNEDRRKQMAEGYGSKGNIIHYTLGNSFNVSVPTNKIAKSRFTLFCSFVECVHVAAGSHVWHQIDS